MERRVHLALGILIILLMSPWSSMVGPEADETQRLDDERDVEFFSIRTDAYSDFVGTYASSDCLLYTSPSPRDMRRSRMPSSA